MLRSDRSRRASERAPEEREGWDSKVLRGRAVLVRFWKKTRFFFVFFGVGFNTIIYASKGAGVFIGKNSAIAGNTYIIDMNHSVKQFNIFAENPLNSANTSERVEIKENVWIGASCVIAKGAKLDAGCIIGANSFVNKEIPENAIAVGNPAKVIKYRE